MGVLTRRSAPPLALISVLSLALTWGASPGAAAAPGLPHYDHVFLIVEENHGFSQIIGNKDARNLNALATKYGLATRYFGVSNPSLPNYLAMLGGSTFNVADDNAYWFHLLHQPSLLSQLEAAKLTWKGYFQSMPYAGFQGDCYPVRCVGMPDQDPLYAVKHNAMPYFASVSGSAGERAKMTPLPQLTTDLAAGRIPNFGYVIPDECHDMHGSPPDCVDSGNPGDAQEHRLISDGDALAGMLVTQLTTAAFWNTGNNAIVITFDEGTDGDTSGCCDANPGSGKVATIVITSKGPRGVSDSTRYNHYSLLQTLQRVFGVGCLQFTCDTKHVTPMTPLFRVA
jgi:phosphoesterase family protein